MRYPMVATIDHYGPRWHNRPMTKQLILAFAAIMLTACPGDDAPPVDESSTGMDQDSTTTTTGPEPTTMPPDLDTTAADTSSSSTAAADSSSSDTTVAAESSTTSDEPPPSGGYGDCANANGSPAACLVVENCLYSGEVGVCSAGGCDDASDCPSSELDPAVPPSDTPAEIVCVDVTGRGLPDCVLDCSVGLTSACPEGMTCLGLGPTAVCLWPVLPGGGGACPDSDLGSAVPQTVMGTTVGLVDDHYALCGYGAGAEDAQHQFTAPAAGMYTFDTFGSGYDTVLAVLDSCGTAGELGCGDDQMGMLSSVTLELAEGQTVIVVVDGYGGAAGPYTLNISAAPAVMVEPLPKPELVLAKQHRYNLMHGIEFTRIE